MTTEPCGRGEAAARQNEIHPPRNLALIDRRLVVVCMVVVELAGQVESHDHADWATTGRKRSHLLLLLLLLDLPARLRCSPDAVYALKLN